MTCSSALDRQDVSVDQIHPEYGSAQYEISVAAEDPVGAADTSVLVRQTIRALSMRHGLYASFSPKVLAEGVGNGGHVHISLWRDDRNLFSGGTGRNEMTPRLRLSPLASWPTCLACWRSGPAPSPATCD